jgi:hypothetical protein
MQLSMATGRRRWQSLGVPPRSRVCSFLEHTKNKQNKTEDLFQHFSGILQAFRRPFGRYFQLSAINAKDFSH